jgi:hypothetical protein
MRCSPQRGRACGACLSRERVYQDVEKGDPRRFSTSLAKSVVFAALRHVQ